MKMKKVFHMVIFLFLVSCGTEIKGEKVGNFTISEDGSIYFKDKKLLRIKKIFFSDYDLKIEENFIVGGFFKKSYTPKKKNEVNIKEKMSFSADGQKLFINTKTDGENSVELEIECDGKELFFGMGMWFDSSISNQKKRFIWVEEGHVGGDDDNPPFPDGEIKTYFPLPFFISNKNYGFLLKSFSPSVFDFCSEEKETLKIILFDSEFSAELYYAPHPLEIVSIYTERTGRPKPVPDWVFSAWIDAIGGSENVRKTAKLIREKGIRADVIWTEDWRGGKKIESLGIYTIGGGTKPSRELYPDFETLAAELKSMGFKFLGYFNSFVLEGDEGWDELIKNNALVKYENGEIVKVSVPESQTAGGVKAGILDLTNEFALNWMKLVMRSAEKYFDGWMADFGEWVPANSKLSDNSTGLKSHNKYPILWQKLQRDFWEEVRPNGDFVFFTRSGYIGTQSLSPVVWPGDQNTSWEKYDGLRSAVVAGISLSFTGVSLYGSDIAGYTSLISPSDKELYIRWTQFGAFSPVMRTHHGTNPDKNWRFDKDDETLALFKFYSEIHEKLKDYLKEYHQKAVEKGFPIIRHILLQNPEYEKFLQSDPECFETEYMLGDYILVAPVVEKGKRERNVFFPSGEWVDIFDSRVYRGPGFFKVQAPLWKIPAFFKKGSIAEKIFSGIYEKCGDYCKAER
jgi:alpha-glucosidase